MKATPHEVHKITYRRVWQGIGKICDVKIDDGYMTIIVKPGEDVKQRSMETKGIFQ